MIKMEKTLYLPTFVKKNNLLHLYVVKDAAKIYTTKPFDFKVFFTTCLNPKKGPLQVVLHFKLKLFIAFFSVSIQKPRC
jgi:hypothetical protein